MKAYIFTSGMLMPVNGSQTKDFHVGYGLRQWNSLLPFLFFIAAKGSSRLVCNAINNGEFQVFGLINMLIIISLICR